MSSFFLWAQSLDNSSPDVIYVNSEALDAKEHLARRQDVVSLVSKVTRTTKARSISDAVAIYLGKEHFVLTVVLPEKDVLNRKAPILCFGELANPENTSASEDALLYISNFIQKIGRTFPASIETDVVSALALAKKKVYPQRYTNIILILLLLSLLFLLCITFFARNG